MASHVGPSPSPPFVAPSVVDNFSETFALYRPYISYSSSVRPHIFSATSLIGNARAADAIAISLGVGETISVSRRAPKSNAAGAIVSSVAVSVTAFDPIAAAARRWCADDARARRAATAVLDDRLASVRARGITARMHRGREAASAMRA